MLYLAKKTDTIFYENNTFFYYYGGFKACHYGQKMCFYEKTHFLTIMGGLKLAIMANKGPITRDIFRAMNAYAGI